MNNEDCKIVTEVFDINEHKVAVCFVQLYRTFKLWIGDEFNPCIENLALALGKSSTQILQQNVDLNDAELAKRLSARFNNNGPFYVSFNYSPASHNPDLKLAIIKKVMEFVEAQFMAISMEKVTLTPIETKA